MLSLLKSLRHFTVFAALGFLLFSGLFLVALWSVHDAINSSPALHVKPFDISKVSARSFAVFDEASGTVIAASNADAQLPIASVTKLITAAVFYTKVDLKATTTILWSDVATDGNAGNLQPKEVLSYRELLYPLLLESSNDAAVTMLRVDPPLLAEMRKRIDSLGLHNTKFQDTSGLSVHNVSTANDLVVIVSRLFKEDPYLFDITRLHQFIGTYTGWLNNNPVVGQKGYRGGKHGYTPEANRTAVAFFDEKLKSGTTRTFGYVLLGSDNIASDIAILRAQVQQNVTME